MTEGYCPKISPTLTRTRLQTVVVVAGWHKMEWKYLQAAAFYDNDSFIKEYLEQHGVVPEQAREQDRTIVTKILHKAAESCSVKVVQAVLNSPHGMY